MLFFGIYRYVIYVMHVMSRMFLKLLYKMQRLLVA